MSTSQQPYSTQSTGVSMQGGLSAGVSSTQEQPTPRGEEIQTSTSEQQRPQQQTWQQSRQEKPSQQTSSTGLAGSQPEPQFPSTTSSLQQQQGGQQLGDQQTESRESGGQQGILGSMTQSFREGYEQSSSGGQESSEQQTQQPQSSSWEQSRQGTSGQQQSYQPEFQKTQQQQPSSYGTEQQTQGGSYQPSSQQSSWQQSRQQGQSSQPYQQQQESRVGYQQPSYQQQQQQPSYSRTEQYQPSQQQGGQMRGQDYTTSGSGERQEDQSLFGQLGQTAGQIGESFQRGYQQSSQGQGGLGQQQYGQPQQYGSQQQFQPRQSQQYGAGGQQYGGREEYGQRQQYQQQQQPQAYGRREEQRYGQQQQYPQQQYGGRQEYYRQEGRPELQGRQYGQQQPQQLQQQYGQQQQPQYRQQQQFGRGQEQPRYQQQPQYQQQQGLQQKGFQGQKKNVVVFAGTGSQGKSIVEELLDSGNWNIRVPGRDFQMAFQDKRVQRMRDRGVDFFTCDWSDYRSVQECLDGAYACFLNINYWDSDVREKEEDIVMTIMKIARDVGVQHLIYSAAPQVEAITEGELNVQHFSSKGRAMDFSRSLGFTFLTHILPSFYYSNWFVFLPPVLQPDGTLHWTIPGKGNQFSSYDAYEDTGRCVKAAFDNPEDFDGKHVCLEGDCLRVTEVMDIIARETGRQVKCTFMDYGNYEKVRKEGGEEIAEMFKWFDDYGYFGPSYEERECIKWNKSKDPLMKDFSQWMDTGCWRNLMQTYANIQI